MGDLVSAFAAVIGTSTVIRHVQHLVGKVAELDAPVLITGEPGTGKEHVAKAVHEKSGRATGPFVPVKCGAIAEDLVEAELFGMLKEDVLLRPGRVEAANGGTLFLDDITRLPLNLQANIMSMLQDGCVVPAGSTKPIRVNVRLICACSQNIELMVRDRLFRDDLYYRLASCSIYLPPLRERREDIPHLVDFFVEKYNQQKGKNIFGASPDAMTALLQHDWANNIQELENLIEKIVVLKNNGSIEICDLPPRLRNFVTDNIDSFYARNPNAAVPREAIRPSGQPTQTTRQSSGAPQASPMAQPYRQQHSSSHHGSSEPTQTTHLPKPPTPPIQQIYNSTPPPPSSFSSPGSRSSYEEDSDIDQFIKKEIELGNGIDFYRVVEEFENRLIAEALRRTNHNKNRAAQLLSMNRTTLVEKLKKRTSSTSVKTEPHRVKRNSAYTIFDSLGSEETVFSNHLDFMTKEDTNLGDLD